LALIGQNRLAWFDAVKTVIGGTPPLLLWPSRLLGIWETAVAVPSSLMVRQPIPLAGFAVQVFVTVRPSRCCNSMRGFLRSRRDVESRD
jgi:hypothetical protein